MQRAVFSSRLAFGELSCRRQTSSIRPRAAASSTVDATLTLLGWSTWATSLYHKRWYEGSRASRSVAKCYRIRRVTESIWPRRITELILPKRGIRFAAILLRGRETFSSRLTLFIHRHRAAPPFLLRPPPLLLARSPSPCSPRPSLLPGTSERHPALLLLHPLASWVEQLPSPSPPDPTTLFPPDPAPRSLLIPRPFPSWLCRSWWTTTALGASAISSTSRSALGRAGPSASSAPSARGTRAASGAGAAAPGGGGATARRWRRRAAR